MEGIVFITLAFVLVCVIAGKDGEVYLLKYRNGNNIIPVNVRLDYKGRVEYVMNLSPHSSEKSLTMYDFDKRYIAFKDLKTKHCFISKMLFETVQTEVDKLKRNQKEIITNAKPVTMYANNRKLPHSTLLRMAGQKIARFCNHMKTSLITKKAKRRARRSRLKRQTDYTRHSYGHYGSQKQEYAHYGHETREAGKGHAPPYQEPYDSKVTNSHRSETKYSTDQSPNKLVRPPFDRHGLQAYQTGGYYLNQPLGLTKNGGSFEAGYRATGNITEGSLYFPNGLPGGRPNFIPTPSWARPNGLSFPNETFEQPPGRPHTPDYDPSFPVYSNRRQFQDSESDKMYPPSFRNETSKQYPDIAQPSKYQPRYPGYPNRGQVRDSGSPSLGQDQVYPFPVRSDGSYDGPPYRPGGPGRVSIGDRTHDSSGRYPDTHPGHRGDGRSVPGSYGGPPSLSTNGHPDLAARPRETRVPGRNGLVPNGADSGSVHEDSSVASDTKVKTGREGTNAQASSMGALHGQRSQTQVQGAHAGNGTFSAQAQAGFVSGSTQSQIRGGRDGGSSLSSASVTDVGSAQSQVQVGTPDGTSSGAAQGTFVSGGTQAEASGFQDGGSAQAQAQSGGLSQSSAQVNARGEIKRQEFFEGEVSAGTRGSLGSGQSSTTLQGAFGNAKRYSAQSRSSFDASNRKDDFRSMSFPLMNKTDMSRSPISSGIESRPFYNENVDAGRTGHRRSGADYGRPDGRTGDEHRRPVTDVDSGGQIPDHRSSTKFGAQHTVTDERVHMKDAYGHAHRQQRPQNGQDQDRQFPSRGLAIDSRGQPTWDHRRDIPRESHHDARGTTARPAVINGNGKTAYSRPVTTHTRGEINGHPTEAAPTQPDRHNYHYRNTSSLYPERKPSRTAYDIRPTSIPHRPGYSDLPSGPMDSVTSKRFPSRPDYPYVPAYTPGVARPNGVPSRSSYPDHPAYPSGQTIDQRGSRSPSTTAFIPSASRPNGVPSSDHHLYHSRDVLDRQRPRVSDTPTYIPGVIRLNGVPSRPSYPDHPSYPSRETTDQQRSSVPDAPAYTPDGIRSDDLPSRSSYPGHPSYPTGETTDRRRPRVLDTPTNTPSVIRPNGIPSRPSYPDHPSYPSTQTPDRQGFRIPGISRANGFPPRPSHPAHPSYPSRETPNRRGYGTPETTAYTPVAIRANGVPSIPSYGDHPSIGTSDRRGSRVPDVPVYTPGNIMPSGVPSIPSYPELRAYPSGETPDRRDSTIPATRRSSYPDTKTKDQSCCTQSDCCVSDLLKRLFNCCRKSSIKTVAAQEDRGSQQCNEAEVTCYTVYKTVGRVRICQPGC